MAFDSTNFPKLIVVRGNSGSGKSAIAAGLREVYGRGHGLHVAHADL